MASTSQPVRAIEDGWDILKWADKVRNLAGILAAFASGALIIVVTNPATGAETHEDEVRQAGQLMLAALFLLIMASILFSGVGGRRAGDGQFKSAVEGFLASWTLALAAVVLCQSMIWLLSGYGFTDAAAVAKFIVVFAALAASEMAASVAVLPLFRRSSREATVSHMAVRPTSIWIAAGLLPVVGLMVGWIMPLHISVNLVVWGSMTLTVLVAVAFAYYSSCDDAWVERFYDSTAGVAGFEVLMLLLSCLYAAYVHLEPA